MIDIRSKSLRSFSVIINILILFFSVALTILQIIPSLLPALGNGIIYVISIILGLEVISIVLNHFYEKYVDYDLYLRYKKDTDKTEGIKNRKAILKEMNPDKCDKTTIQNSRDKLRFGLNILLTVSIILCLYWCYLTRDIWTFVMSICLLIITYLYADYIPHTVYYSKHYDSLFITDKNNTKSFRGLARIYLEEYRQTQFNLNDKFYKKINEYLEDEHSVIQDECIKHTLYMNANSCNSINVVVSIIIMFFNVLLVLPGAADQIIQNITGNFVVNCNYFSGIMILLINIIFASVNISALYKYAEESNMIYSIYEALKSQDFRDRLHIYNDLLRKDPKNLEIMRARGIFTFCSTYMDENKNLDSVDLKYKMLFSHRYYANKPRFIITACLLFVAMISSMIKYGLNYYLCLIIAFGYIILSILFFYLYLPILGKTIIKKNCHKLDECSIDK